jgi:hypothetical protein
MLSLKSSFPRPLLKILCLLVTGIGSVSFPLLGEEQAISLHEPISTLQFPQLILMRDYITLILPWQKLILAITGNITNRVI